MGNWKTVVHVKPNWLMHSYISFVTWEQVKFHKKTGHIYSGPSSGQ